jgi:hypothetical protein
VRASRAGEVIEARFSGERVTSNFRVGGKPMTIRAATGFTPSFYATNNAHPLILADGPLTLEGLTLVRRVRGVAFTPLVEVQGVPVVMLNCRLFRGVPQAGGDTVIKTGRLVRVEDETRPSPPLIVLTPGSVCSMRNCLMLGSLGTAVALLGGTKESIRVEIENSLFAMHRIFALRSEPGFGAELDSSGSVFASEVLMELGNAEAIRNVTANWTDCALDLSQGTFLRLNDYGSGDWLRAVSWKETGTIYAGSGVFLADRKNRRVVSEPEWNLLMGLSTNSHAVTPHQVFAGIRARSSQQLNGRDVNAELLRQDSEAKLKFVSDWIGEGEPYARFRRQPDYRRWREHVNLAVQEWLQSRATSSSHSR